MIWMLEDRGERRENLRPNQLRNSVVRVGVSHPGFIMNTRRRTGLLKSPGISR